MEDLLLLAHRIPYPPNKGDKLRSYNLLRMLVRHYRVHLGAFVDDPSDLCHRPVLEDLCAEVMLPRLHPKPARVASLRGLATGAPLSLAYYAHAGLRRWVAQRIAAGVRHIVVFSSAMAPYAEPHTHCRRVADMVDVDSAKWSAYGAETAGPLGWIYRREGRRLAAYERRIARSFDATLFVSQAEADCFLEGAPETAPRVHAAGNGVDTDFFDPDGDFATPFQGEGPVLVFTGAMDYRPNVDAVVWFAGEVLPRLQQLRPGVRFCIVGGNPAPAVQRLAQQPGIQVTGRVPDVRPYLACADVAVAPLRIARGIQNKVLEAMAMARPVVCTPAALEGIEARPGEHLQVASDPAELAACIDELLGSPERRASLGRAARARLLERYRWERQLAPVLALLAGVPPGGGEDYAGEASDGLVPR